MDYWTLAEQHIIEDSVLFNPTRTLDILKKSGHKKPSGTAFKNRMVERFIRFDEESNHLIPGNGSQLTIDELEAVRLLLGHSQFFTHKLHLQPHIDTLKYLDAKVELGDTFKVTIPL